MQDRSGGKGREPGGRLIGWARGGGFDGIDSPK